MDFTLKIYCKLLGELIRAGYNFQTFSEYLAYPDPKVILLRHDVEARYGNALEFAIMQHKLNIRGTYYFRFLKNHYDAGIIKQIADLNHEIGYHYDDLSYCRGDYEKAIIRFQNNLNTLREIGPVKTICMEGNPQSSYDNRSLWEKYKFQDFQISGEPYFSIDFNEVFYFTDTGRTWSGKYSVRDKTTKKNQIKKKEFKTTNDIIIAAKQDKLPNKIMITFHPQRWNDNLLPWLQEFVFQTIKNQIKRFYIRKTI